MSANSARFSGTSTAPAPTSASVAPAACPWKSTLPPRRGTSPITAPISVVLPAPLGPTMATMLPSGTERLTPCSTSTWP